MVLTNLRDVCPYSVSICLLQYEEAHFGSYKAMKGETYSNIFRVTYAAKKHSISRQYIPPVTRKLYNKLHGVRL